MSLLSQITSDWRGILETAVDTETLEDLESRLQSAGEIEPPRKHIFRAFDLCPYSETRVVILGQDPYSDGRSTGLAFAVREPNPNLGSLWKIFKRLKEAGFDRPRGSELEGWARQGVLLLNTVLTVPKGPPRECAHGHRDWGWQKIATAAVEALKAPREKPVLFLAWGIPAMDIIQPDKDPQNRWWCHHPASSSRGEHAFSRCDHFLRINDWFAAAGLQPIKWDQN